MKRVVCVCNTYYQLIFSIQLKKTIHHNDYFAVIVSDHSKNYAKIAENLCNCGIFDNVYVVNTKRFDEERCNPMKLAKYGRTIFSMLPDYCFDDLLFFNRSKSTTALWDLIYQTNPKARSIKFEEGVLSYNGIDHKHIPVCSFEYVDRALYYIRRFFPRINLIDKTESFYCFYPPIYRGDLEAVGVPLIDKNVIGQAIAETFGVDKLELVYQEKYIFFTSVYDFEGGEAIGELELARAIAKKVGKDNLLVKMHPRDSRSVYADEGFHIDTNSSIPFEALLFAYDFSNKVLLTATSGAVLSASLMHDNPPKTYYMYPLCNIGDNPAAQNTVKQIDQVLRHESMKESLKRIYLCESLDTLD